MFTTHQSWDAVTKGQIGTGAAAAPSPNLDFSTGQTGMTPMPDGIWPADGIGDGDNWMMGWLGSTPQPQ
jgi:hypothetical protein